MSRKSFWVLVFVLPALLVIGGCVAPPPTTEFKIIKVENKVFETEVWEVKLVSYEIFEDGKVQLAFLYKNKSKDTKWLMLSKPKKNTYLVDNLGYQYFYDSSPPLTGKEWKEFPAGIGFRVFFTFPKLREGVKSIDFVSRHSYTPDPSTYISHRVSVLVTDIKLAE